MSVITKKAEKIEATVQYLEAGFPFEQFLEAFKVKFPKDWLKVEREFAKHDRNTKPGKSHPMPNPVQYMRNTLNFHLKSSKATK